MRTLCASVLAFEALVVALAIVPALTLTDTHHTVIVAGGLSVVALCVLAAGTLRSPTGYVIGSAVQLLVVVTYSTPAHARAAGHTANASAPTNTFRRGAAPRERSGEPSPCPLGVSGALRPRASRRRDGRTRR